MTLVMNLLAVIGILALATFMAASLMSGPMADLVDGKASR